MNRSKDRDMKIVGTSEYIGVNEYGNYWNKKNSWKNYLDFELEMDSVIGGEYQVTIIRSPAGEVREIMHFPCNEQMFDRNYRDFGKKLFNTLFTGEIRNRYDVSKERVRSENKGLRIKLRIRPPELAVLPWELMFDPRQAEFLCLSCNTSVVRYLELPLSVLPLAVKPPLRILGMVSIPDNLMSLDIDNEKHWIEKALKDLQAEGLVELTWLPGGTWRDLQEAMQTGKWNIFHFIGHGEFDENSNEGLIALAQEDGKTHLFSATELGRLLADHYPLRLVILNSCKGAMGSESDVFSSTASILVRRGIPAVIAMQQKISDDAAIEFSRTFYRAISSRMPVDAAVAEARKVISFAVKNTVEWGTPVLIMRSSEGMLFKEEEIEENEEMEKEIKEELVGNMDKVEQFVGFILAKQNAIFQYERNGKRFYKVPTKGISEFSINIIGLENKVSLIIRIAGYGKVPDQIYDKIRKELKHFNEA